MSIRIINPKSWHSTLWMLRERPGMYLGSPTLKGLMHYVDGIRWAEHLYEIPHSKRLDDFSWDRFEPWLRTRLKQHKRSFIRALEMTKTDKEAFDLWFTWYDEYNATEGKEDHETWRKLNEQDELHRYADADDNRGDPSLY